MTNDKTTRIDSRRILDSFENSEFAPLLFTYDREGRILHANASAESLLSERVNDLNIKEILINIDPCGINDIYEGRISIQLPDTNVFGAQVVIEKNDNLFFAVCYADVKEQLMLEKKLFQTNQQVANLSRNLFKKNFELEKTNSLKDEFVSILSHDLRGPLRRVHSFAELLELDLAGKITEDQKEYLCFIKKESKIMHQMVLDILNYEAIESGKFKLNLQNVDVNELVTELVAGTARSAAEKNIRIQPQLNAAAPVITADYVKIRQVIENVMTNCVKYTPEDGIVSIETDNSPGFVHITIKDNGTGFGSGEIETIFEPFRKGLAAGSKSDSFGFGMAIVKKIVDSHKGQIVVSNVPTGGAQFEIQFPI